MSNLPEWILNEFLNECDCGGCAYAIHMHNALVIAWEALFEIAECDAEICPESQGKYKAKEAMRQIEELGK